MFNNQRYATRGIVEEIPMLTQFFLWNIIDTMPEPKDGFQVFKLSERSGLQVIEHYQEIPEYRKDCCFSSRRGLYAFTRYHWEFQQR